MTKLLFNIILLIVIFISSYYKSSLSILILFLYSLGLGIYNIRFGFNYSFVLGLLGTWLASRLYFNRINYNEGYSNNVNIKEAKDTFGEIDKKYDILLNNLDNDIYKVIKEYYIGTNVNELLEILIPIESLYELCNLVIIQNNNHKIFNYLDIKIKEFALLYKVPCPNITIENIIYYVSNNITLDVLSDKYKRNSIIKNEYFLSGLEYIFKEKIFIPPSILFLEDFLLQDTKLSLEDMNYNIYTEDEIVKDYMSLLILFEKNGLFNYTSIGETVNDLREIDWLNSILKKINIDNILDNNLVKKYKIDLKLKLFTKINSFEEEEEISKKVLNIPIKNNFNTIKLINKIPNPPIKNSFKDLFFKQIDHFKPFNDRLVSKIKETGNSKNNLYQIGIISIVISLLIAIFN